MTHAERPADGGWAWPVAFILLAALVVLAAGIGLRSPWPADEPRFAQIAREMVESGQWLFPTRGGEPYPDKPPVFIWLVALFYLATGQLKVAFLLPSALAGLGTLWLVHDIGRRLWGRDVARYALLILLFTPQFFMQAKSAQLDALVTFWITLGCYGLLRHFVLGPSWGWYCGAFAAMALGIMTKGVGFLPALMLIPFALWGSRAGAGPSGKVWGARSWLGLLVLLGTLALWLGPMLWTVAASGSDALRAYRDNILFHQTAGRYANPWGHINAWHYLFTVAIPSVWLPLLVLMLTQWRRLGRLLKEDSTARVLFTWALMVLVFFSLSRGKRVVYILPALPMLCLVAGALWRRALDDGGTRTSALALRAVVVLMGLGLAALGAVAWLHPALLGPKVDDYGDVLAVIALPVLGMGVGVLALAAATWRRDALASLAAVSLLCWFALSCWVWPAMDAHRTPKALMQALERAVDARHEVGLLQFKEQFLLFSHRPLTHFSVLAPVAEQERNAWRWMQEDPSRVLLVPDSLDLACFDMHRLRVLGNAHRQDWGLLDAGAMKPRCEPPLKALRYTWRPQRLDILD